MKWEKLKRDLANKLAGNCSPVRGREYAAMLKVIEDNHHSTWRENLKELNDLIFERVMNWDIRCAKQLIDLFPLEFPKKFRNSQLQAFMDEKGDWCIEPQQ